MHLSYLWMLPFVGILLSIAIIPLINGHFWEKNLWWISLFVFAAPMLVPLLFFLGPDIRHLTFEKTFEYISFILLLASLYTISGGIHISGSMSGTPFSNSVFLLIGSFVASFIGTTGASMLLIRPLIRANRTRTHKVHTIIFFIFLVSNIGGILTPLGDPPLFLGYLQGVPFEWTFRLAPEWALTASIVLMIYLIYDSYLFRKETKETFKKEGGSGLGTLKRDVDICMVELDESIEDTHNIRLSTLKKSRDVFERVSTHLEDILKGSAPLTEKNSFHITGKWNFLLLAGVVASIYFQGSMMRSFPKSWPTFGPQEGGMILMMMLSLLITPVASSVRKNNGFTFGPIKEVAALFAAIFATMVPALYILEHEGAKLGVTQGWQFFWATGLLSSFLDNAPTYLTFLSLGKGLHLPNDLGFVLSDGSNVTKEILTAISCGSVFMGANTYIGNGPNFMVRSIAESYGIKMPSFFGYMLYSGVVLIPVFILLTFIFFT